MPQSNGSLDYSAASYDEAYSILDSYNPLQLVIYTDGGSLQTPFDITSWAFTVNNANEQLVRKSGLIHRPYAAAGELEAVNQALEWLIKKHYKDCYILIDTDFLQNVYLAQKTDASVPASKLVSKRVCQSWIQISHFQKMYRQFPHLHIRHVKGHSGILGNDQVDELCTEQIDRAKNQPSIAKKINSIAKKITTNKSNSFEDIFVELFGHPLRFDTNHSSKIQIDGTDVITNLKYHIIYHGKKHQLTAGLKVTNLPPETNNKAYRKAYVKLIKRTMKFVSFSISYQEERITLVMQQVVRANIPKKLQQLRYAISQIDIEHLNKQFNHIKGRVTIQPPKKPKKNSKGNSKTHLEARIHTLRKELQNNQRNAISSIDKFIVILILINIFISLCIMWKLI